MPPDNETTVRGLILHPISVLTGLFGVSSTLFQLGALDALWATLWTNAGTLFTALSVIKSQTDGPFLGVIPQTALTAGVAAVGALFVLSLLDRFLESFMQRLSGNETEEDNT